MKRLIALLAMVVLLAGAQYVWAQQEEPEDTMALEDVDTTAFVADSAMAVLQALNIVWVFVWHFFVWRLMNYQLIHFLKDTLPFALAAAAVMAVTGLLTQTIPVLWLKLAVRIVLAAIFYIMVMRLFGAVILKECMAFIQSRIKRN